MVKKIKKPPLRKLEPNLIEVSPGTWYGVHKNYKPTVFKVVQGRFRRKVKPLPDEYNRALSDSRDLINVLENLSQTTQNYMIHVNDVTPHVENLVKQKPKFEDIHKQMFEAANSKDKSKLKGLHKKYTGMLYAEEIRRAQLSRKVAKYLN